NRVIITTRDEQVLVAHGVSLIRDVNLLSHGEALCLFSRYAFGRGIPIQGYTELSRMVVRYAAGLPLTIRETLDKLELSYISLEEDYKKIFLDVACVLKGWPKDAAIRVIESYGLHARNALRVLEQKSLITIIHNEYLGMHDHIEEIGKNIVCTKATRCIKLSMLNLTPLIVMKGLGNMKELRFLNVGSGRNDPPFGFLKHGQVSQYLSLSHCYGKFDEVS
ncbi:TMV resistance protein N-like protein, partial [Tanacetum coccineum]